MDLNDLQCFTQVVRHGGFTAAARATGEPKSKLSKCVARLERDLGVRLIERSTRSIRVTDIGHEIYRQCEIIAGGIETTQALAARTQGTVSGPLHVSCPPALLQMVGTAIFTEFLARYPEVRLRLRVSNQPVDLINEQVDVAIRVRTKLETDHSLTMRTLGRSGLILVASPKILEGVRLDEPSNLATLPTLSMNDSPERARWDLVSAGGDATTVVHAPRLCCESIDMLRDAALAGLGVALIPQDICLCALHKGDLVQVLPDWGTPEGIVHLVFTTPRGMLPAVRAFVDHYAAAFTQMRERAGRDERQQAA